MLDLIGFDADDTLWHNEDLYSDARVRFREILSGFDLPINLDDVIHDVEVGNLRYYGYGVMSFALSLIETAVRLTGGRVTGQEIGELVQLGKSMMSAEVRLFDQVEDTLAALAATHPLALITKGDLQHQQAKVARSGLARYFRSVEIVSDKTPATYAAILARHGVSPDRFVMVGNSLRSDILPVVELGAHAIYIPHANTWIHEHVELEEGGDGGFVTATSLAEVLAAIRSLDSQA